MRFIKNNSLPLGITTIVIILIILSFTYLRSYNQSIGVTIAAVMALGGMWIGRLSEVAEIEVSVRRSKENYLPVLNKSPRYEVLVKKPEGSTPVSIKSYSFSGCGLMPLGEGTPLPSDGFPIPIPPQDDKDPMNRRHFLTIIFKDENEKEYGRQYQISFDKDTMRFERPILIDKKLRR